MNKDILLKAIRVLAIVFLFAVLGGRDAYAIDIGLSDDYANVAPAFTSNTINIPGAQITALDVYQTGNKIFVADDNSQSVVVLDGTNDQIITTIPSVGGAVFQMTVNETQGKVYAASDKSCCTSGITPGNGLISVINANTNQIITQINPGTQGNVSYFILGNDEVHGKIYVAFFSGVGVIDAATNTFTLIPNAGAPYPSLDQMGINTVTNEVFLPTYNSGLTVINGSTLSVQTIPYPANSGQVLDVAVNEIENKVYMTMIMIPGQAEMGIAILDRDTGVFQFVGAADLEPLAFNNLSNRLFTGIQIGSQASIVEGATDQLTYINLGTNGIGAVAVRESTDHAYLVNQQYTTIVDGLTKTVSQQIPSNIPPSGGLIINDISINQNTGRVYAVNDDETGSIMVVQDALPPPPIFADSFESGDLSAWSPCVIDGGDLSVSAAAKLVGNFGMQAFLDDNIVIYCTSDHPAAEPRYVASFYFDPNSIAMVNGDTHTIFGGYMGTNTLVLRLQFRRSSNLYQVQAAILNDGSTFTPGGWVTISDAPHQIKLDWRAASAAGANDGRLTLWVDNNQAADLTAVDNDTRRIDRARLGAVAAIDTGTRGTYYFDGFESSRGDGGPTPTATLTVNKTGTGSGTVTSNPAGIDCGSTCSHAFNTNTAVTLTAAPAAGSTFTGWSGGGCSGTGTCIVTLTADTSVTANFDLQASSYTLTVNKTGTGSGTVTSSPAGIDCGSDCSEAYPANTSVTLTATAAGGSTFTGWSGGGCSGTGACIVTMSANTSVTANFDLVSSDLIFSDGFESCNLSAWSSSTIDGGDLSAGSPGLVGSCSMRALIDDNILIYVTSDHPNAEPGYRARFYFDPNSIAMVNGDLHRIFYGYNGTSKVVLRVEFRRSNNLYQLRAGLLTDGSAWRNSTWFTITDAPHPVELDWRAATAAGANNGALTFWIDGVQKANLTAVDNDTWRIDRARVGTVNGIDTGTRGTYYFDAFESRRQTYIGP